MNRIIRSAIVIFAVSLMACTNQNASNSEQTMNDMNSFISLFEIPATDISRAISFYQGILDINIEKMEMPGMEMGIFPYQDQLVPGVIVKAEGYEPSANGVTIYLNAGDDLQHILDKVEVNGGTIILPKTAHAD